MNKRLADLRKNLGRLARREVPFYSQLTDHMMLFPDDAELLVKALDRLEALDELVQAAEKTCAVVERVLDADASEGTPIWEWTDDEADAGVREVLAVANELMTALDRAQEDEGADR
jgi:hypothetical protein